jgi:hypothetical protein
LIPRFETNAYGLTIGVFFYVQGVRLVFTSGEKIADLTKPFFQETGKRYGKRHLQDRDAPANGQR